MRDLELPLLLDRVLNLLSQADTSGSIGIEQALVGMGCPAAKAELLADYLPATCGRAFLREIGLRPSDTYRRSKADGSWGAPTAFSDDPLWGDVEAFVETIRTDPQRRKQFGAVARLSAEVHAVDNALNSGKSLAEMAGSNFASVFVAPLRHKP
ncbi:MAG: hypothetical protein K2P58_10455 [Hyphomonadaceae bacterium]|nr:hypothetical protein [Hyphomonadaceae bacterium]